MEDVLPQCAYIKLIRLRLEYQSCDSHNLK